MYKIQPVIEHIEKVYGFEVVPCSIPRNNFQYFKRHIYLFIHDKISKKLFFFLRDKVSTIKYLDERPNGEIWLRKKNSENKVSIEVEIKPINGDYEVTLYHGNYGECFILNHINDIDLVDNHFSKINELKSELRNHKLKNILI